MHKWLSWVLLRSLKGYSEGAGQAVVSREGLTEEGSVFKFTHMVIDKIQSLTECWTEGLSLFLAVG